MFCYSQYGFKTKAITELAHQLSGILKFEWERLNNDTWGSYYRYPAAQPGTEPPDEYYILYLNKKEWNATPKNRDNKQFHTLMTVRTNRPLDIDLLLFPLFKNRIAVLERYLHNTTTTI